MMLALDLSRDEIISQEVKEVSYRRTSAVNLFKVVYST